MTEPETPVNEISPPPDLAERPPVGFSSEKKARSEYMREYMRAYRAKKASQKAQERG